MKFIKIILSITFICSSTAFVFGQNITIDDTKTALDLVKVLTNNSPCIITSGETVIGDTFTTGKNSYAYFNNAGGNFPFSEGVILNTWSALNSIGPYVSGNNGGGDTKWNGDSDLDQTLGVNSKNATLLEFDFTPLTNSISFNYIFASNEYQSNFPCRFSDGFAFLIKENSTGSSYQNLAIIPSTSIPVSSENIHPLINDFSDISGLHKGCSSINENYFNGFNSASSPINYSGQTIIMNAQTSVIIGKNYHIKLVIADDNNEYFDSAIFLQAGSFSSKIDLGINHTLTTNNSICFGESFLIDTKLPANYNYKWYKNGSSIPIPNETNPTYTAIDSGTYKVEVDLGTGCIATGEIIIEFNPQISLNSTSLSKCDDNGNGTATFDLTKAETVIKNNNTNLTTIDYYENQTGSLLSNLITNPKLFTKTTVSDQTVYAQVKNIYGCTETTTLTLKTIPSKINPLIVVPSPIINDFAENKNSIELIPPTTGGLYDFSLDGINYQASPLFTNLSIGNYNAYIRETTTCEYLTYPITLLDYPRFFTPNGDGYDDTWKIKNLNLFPKAVVTIFDRYGKLLTQLNTINNSWDGKFNSYELPADDYWFSLNFDDGKIIKGHFSLKR